MFLVAWGAAFRPEIRDRVEAFDEEIVDELESLRRPRLNPEEQHVVWQDVDTSEGMAAPWYPKGESPILAELVREGKLPPVEERVGPEPVVLDGLAGIGSYGGTWFRVETSALRVGPSNRRMSCSYFLRQSAQGFPLVPHIAKAWEASADKRVWTIYLRKGARWSDGHPFTADDIVYTWTKDLEATGASPNKWMKAARNAGRVDKIDEYTVRFEFPVPNLLFAEKMSVAISSNIYSPRHYLEPYHPIYGNAELIEASMKARNLTSRVSLYSSLKVWSNPEYPRMWPWVFRTHTLNPPFIFVRNPYYYAVDREGNQLPYIDRIFYDIKPPQLLPAAAAGGHITMQAFNLQFRDYTMLMSERAAGNYEVFHWYPTDRSQWTMHPNLNRYIDPDEPVHESLNGNSSTTCAFGAPSPSPSIGNKSSMPYFTGSANPPRSHRDPIPFFIPSISPTPIPTTIPSRLPACSMKSGSPVTDSEGYRTFRNGTRMTWSLEMSVFTDPGPAQFIVDDWAAVGIRAVQRERSARLYIVQGAARKVDFEVIQGQAGLNPLLTPRNICPAYGFSRFARSYGRWYLQGGLEGNPEALLQGGEAPPIDHPLRRSLRVYEEAYTATSYEEMRDIFEEAMDIAAENVWTVSIATPPPQLAIVSNDILGVPRNVLYGGRVPGKLGAETFYLREPGDSPGTLEEIKREMVEVTARPGTIDVETLQPRETGAFSALIRRILYAIVAIGLILAGVRHPYIGRRLIIMVPTLIIISVISFIIIQAPPGNFLETLILQLEMSGEEASLEQVENLKELFHLEDPLHIQYARWLGLYWFGSFDDIDLGLLQGHMGRSMENSESVNDIVGDRILLTFLISLGTILFTWAVAVPIGIFSAVRQYSPGDYLFTFIGFIGMCIPNFLLALLLMYWANRYFGINMGGLFSPEFAAQKEWNAAKFFDLLQHIWLPVVVIGTSGTAGMIRVMRANLLDELKKPYVTTAQAKGVRPTKLLLKYPVRLALNPFISGIGGIFPHLVSGGAIVAIVLSLPTVGPLMLNGLMSEDMYLAGSMLMVLSFLAVLGTLVSDLLLMVLDPRIRMEGGSR